MSFNTAWLYLHGTSTCVFTIGFVDLFQLHTGALSQALSVDTA